MEMKANEAQLPSCFSNVPAFEMLGTFAALATILALMLHLHLDYLAFIALGPGGTPSTLSGFTKLKLLSFFAISDPYKPRLAPRGDDLGGYLTGLQNRSGDRPVTSGIAPHRQATAKASQKTHEKLSHEIVAMPATFPALVVGVSCFEGHGIALFNRLCTKQAEICHIHTSDGSMHMVLGNSDSKLVLDAGWGERHPLSRGGWFERFVPAGFMMIYAPQDEADVETVLRIVRAAA